MNGIGILLLAQKERHPGKAGAGYQRHDVAPEARQAQIIQEKEQHAQQDGHQGDPIHPPRPFAQKPVAEERHVGRCGVLQQNGVGRAGELVGGHEAGDADRVGHGPADQVAVEAKAPGPEEQQQKERADGAAHAGDGQGRPLHPLDEKTAGAPDQGRDQKQAYRARTLHHPPADSGSACRSTNSKRWGAGCRSTGPRRCVRALWVFLPGTCSPHSRG